LTLDIHPELADLAYTNLQKSGIKNVEVRVADASQGLLAEGPFDAIMLSGSVAHVPKQLLEQLTTGGRLIAIVGDEPIMSATLFTRVGDTDFHSVKLWDANAPRLENFAETSQFVF
jgi:protein-L-isoaspartate(D-aspartate) O-methyltransferase